MTSSRSSDWWLEYLGTYLHGFGSLAQFRVLGRDGSAYYLLMSGISGCFICFSFEGALRESFVARVSVCVVLPSYRVRD